MPADVIDAGWLRLTLIPGIGRETQRKLLAAFGLPEHIFAASFSALSSCIGEKAARLLVETDNQEAIARAIEWASHPGQHILALSDSDYPRSLLDIPDPPTILYVRGQLEQLRLPAVAIVGSRNATPQGESNARAFAGALANRGLCIISGLALGIDAAAHCGALAAGGATIAVIGTGADRLYPARNQKLAVEIAEKGVIISEFPLGTPAAAANFPRRNRLISGLSRGVLVVEAAVESGSLITARMAGEQGREVFAIPGSIHSPQSRGCHRLIRQGAKLVETAQDVLEELNLSEECQQHPLPTSDIPSGGNNSYALLPFVGFDPVTMDELVGRSGLTAEAVSVILLELELDGQVSSLPGGRFQRLTELHTPQ